MMGTMSLIDLLSTLQQIQFQQKQPNRDLQLRYIIDSVTVPDKEILSTDHSTFSIFQKISGSGKDHIQGLEKILRKPIASQLRLVAKLIQNALHYTSENLQSPYWKTRFRVRLMFIWHSISADQILFSPTTLRMKIPRFNTTEPKSTLVRPAYSGGHKLK